MKHSLFFDAFREVDIYLKSNSQNLTGNDLFQIKSDFYQGVQSLCGSTDNLTGITELLVFRFMYHFLGMKGQVNSKAKVVQHSDHSLYIGKRYIGKNGNYQAPDIVLEKDGVIKNLISVKNLLSTTSPTIHEKESLLYQELKKKNNNISSTAIQDIFRIDNIRHKQHKDFKSVTVVFSDVPKRHLRAVEVVHQEFDWHRFLILENNHQTVYQFLKKHFSTDKK